MDLEKTGAQTTIYLSFLKQLNLVSTKTTQLHIFLDVEQTFNKVWSNGLLFKLTSMGLIGT